MSARQMLEYARIRGEGVVVVTGDAGCGKTMLMRSFVAVAPENLVLGVCPNPGLLEASLYHGVLEAFGFDTADKAGLELHAELREFMRTQFAEGNSIMLMVDESQHLSAATLENLRLLMNVEFSGAMQLVLIGQPRLKQLLRSCDLTQLAQCVLLSLHLGPMDAEETAAYIRYRLESAGAQRPLFSDLAIEAVYRSTQGVPRLINMICDMALLYGYAEESSQIDADVIRTVVKDREISGSGRSMLINESGLQLGSTNSGAAGLPMEQGDRETARQLFGMPLDRD